MMKIEEQPPISPPINPSSSFRNWSDLPQTLLVSILHRLLFSIPDFLTFAAVCRPWQSAAAAFSSSRGPPLFLNPVVSTGRSLSSSAALSRLQTLNRRNGVAGPCRTQPLKIQCVGWSYGQLIFVPAGQNAVLADVFTGHEIQSPRFPDNYKDFSFGILTAPLTSSSCFLLLAVSSYFPTSILCWAPGSSNKWSELNYRSSCYSLIISMVVSKGRVFGLTEFLNIIVVELASVSLKEIEIQMPDVEYLRQASPDTQLVECGEELLLINFSPSYWTPGRAVVGVYRLDLLKCRWVKMEFLGDWCLFIDAVRKPAIVCRDPTSWGGRNNCIYFAKPGCDTWMVVPLDGEEHDICVSNMKLSKWPSPVWVYPRFVREGIQTEGRPAFSEPSKDYVLVQFLKNVGEIEDETEDEDEDEERCVFAADDQDDGDDDQDDGDDDQDDDQDDGDDDQDDGDDASE